MTLSITQAGIIQTFNIGESSIAQKAIQSYERYQAGHKYEDLKNCFAYLSFSVDATPQHKKAACLASEALAASTLDFQTDIYKKLFIANSVTSIIAKANLEKSLELIKLIWEPKMNDYGQIIARNPLDVKAAQEAGLAVVDVKPKN